MTAGPATSLGIIAGRGSLPKSVAEARLAAGLPYFVVGLQGFAGDWIIEHPHRIVSILAVGKLLNAFKEAECTHVTMAGGVERPSINQLKLDAKALSWLPKLLPALRRGDDNLLRTIRELLEAEGLILVGADTILPLTHDDATLTITQPSAEDISDVDRAEGLLRDLAPHDVGQGVVVAQGLVLGIETIQGTDSMLNFVASDRRGQGGVLVKRLKLGQDRALDMPVIGPNTIKSAVAAGLNGIVVEANGVMILERAETIAAANAAKIFIWVKS
ncbi:hypothetical protein SAMN06273572_102282 [Monaibacterium marinum]|uniref:Phosphatidate cytidylyltransferase n=1 Tax=Pontivivens marinum TaxID=1690039 RepID=A0A2C9CR04_9RHOB|nr:UDP-2,3-diacylglucosamine diphosphatase LpxI [Monaibacterium marinum]SOH93605.1 hypothetical protein SAMN06273572_102282 [Monaibacterium marinum]